MLEKYIQLKYNKNTYIWLKCSILQFFLKCPIYDFSSNYDSEEFSQLGCIPVKELTFLYNYTHQEGLGNKTFVAYCGEIVKNYRDVKCDPKPDAFNPCEDIMGNLALRIAVWFVVVTAVVGNVAVMLVLLSSRFR